MKKNNLKQWGLLLLVLLFTSNIAYSQFKGKGASNKIYTVKEVLDNASKLDRSDAVVKVKGFIIEQINSDTYKFKDNTGVIQVEIKKKRLPATPFDEKTELILIGEVDNDLFQPVEIEVDEVIIANQLKTEVKKK